MKPRISTTSALVIAAGCLVLGTTAGAVAGSQITGAQIKNNTVASVDVKNHTLLTKDLAPSAVKALKGKKGPKGATGARGPAGALGREVVQNNVVVPANTSKDAFTAECPAGKVVVGGSAWWASSRASVQSVFNDSAVKAYTAGLPAQDSLYVQAICVSE